MESHVEGRRKAVLLSRVLHVPPVLVNEHVVRNVAPISLKYNRVVRFDRGMVIL
jgi:hypothetical protein